MNKPIAVDLFAGVGGMGLGFQQAGFNVAVAVEIDQTHSFYHSLNFPETLMMNSDINLLNGEEIRNLSTIKNNDITCVFGGSPCQGFSIEGHRNNKDIRNNLALEFVRIVCQLQPRYFVFENVKGILSSYGKIILKNMIAKLNESAYKVLPYKIWNAKDFGVPQHRERLIMIGYRNDCNAPLPIKPPGHINYVWDALADLPEASHYPKLFDQDFTECEYGVPSNYAKLLMVENSKQITSSKLTRHSPEIIDRFTATKPGERDSISRFRKLEAIGLSPTLKAGTGAEKGNHTAQRPIHPFYPRVITVREAARLHSYPDSFVFHPSCMWGMRQIGNSVPPMMARAIAESIPQN